MPHRLALLATMLVATGTSVSIDNFTFDPPEIAVPVGAAVTWTNHDDIPHTVTAQDRSFASDALDTDDAFTARFAKPGRFVYFCSLHPHMQGVVVVTPGPG